MSKQGRELAIVTGASSGIGLELAKLCADSGYDLVVAADEPEIEAAAASLRERGVGVRAVQADLATIEGVDALYEATKSLPRPVDALLANAGHGLGRAFLDQEFEDALHVINTNITGAAYLAHKIGRDMRARGEGKILFTGSIAGFMPGSFQAVYNASKAFIDSFSYALRNELQDSGVTVTCLMPGPTETEFFERADLMDTKVGQQKKDDAGAVAMTGFEAMMKGEAGVIHGAKNKMQAAMAGVLPKTTLAEQHRGMTEPGSGEDRPARAKL